MSSRSTKAEQFERALLDQIERLDARIARLRSQQAALRSTLIDHRLQKLSYKGAIRLSSFSAMMVAKKVTDQLRRSGREMQVKALYEAAIQGNDEFPIPMTTFRSHIHRMKRDGLIVKGYARGGYRLGPNAPTR